MPKTNEGALPGSVQAPTPLSALGCSVKDPLQNVLRERKKKHRQRKGMGVLLRQSKTQKHTHRHPRPSARSALSCLGVPQVRVQ
jgi:hypothetical protein